MLPVVMESPLRGDTELNLKYARLCVRDCLLRGEAPMASHLIYALPGVLDDDNAIARTMGMAAGWDWIPLVTRVVIYLDLGWTPGMWQGYGRADHHRKELLFRFLGMQYLAGHQINGDKRFERPSEHTHDILDHHRQLRKDAAAADSGASTNEG